MIHDSRFVIVCSAFCFLFSTCCWLLAAGCLLVPRAVTAQRLFPPLRSLTLKSRTEASPARATLHSTVAHTHTRTHIRTRALLVGAPILCHFFPPVRSSLSFSFLDPGPTLFSITLSPHLQRCSTACVVQVYHTALRLLLFISSTSSTCLVARRARSLSYTTCLERVDLPFHFA